MFFKMVQVHSFCCLLSFLVGKSLIPYILVPTKQNSEISLCFEKSIYQYVVSSWRIISPVGHV